jgi:hypothetical protein
MWELDFDFDIDIEVILQPSWVKRKVASQVGEDAGKDWAGRGAFEWYTVPWEERPLIGWFLQSVLWQSTTVPIGSQMVFPFCCAEGFSSTCVTNLLTLGSLSVISGELELPSGATIPLREGDLPNRNPYMPDLDEVMFWKNGKPSLLLFYHRMPHVEYFSAISAKVHEVRPHASKNILNNAHYEWWCYWQIAQKNPRVKKKPKSVASYEEQFAGQDCEFLKIAKFFHWVGITNFWVGVVLLQCAIRITR